jgi:hypothetical protein
MVKYLLLYLRKRPNVPHGKHNTSSQIITPQNKLNEKEKERKHNFSITLRSHIPGKVEQSQYSDLVDDPKLLSTKQKV